MRKLQLYTMSNRYETFLLGKWNWRKEKNFKNEKEKKAHFTQCQTEIKLSCPARRKKKMEKDEEKNFKKWKKEKNAHFTQCQTEIKLSCPARTKKNGKR